jgi:uncharacterized protein
MRSIFPASRGVLRSPQLVWGCVGLGSLIGLLGTYVFVVEPAPPQHLVIAASNAHSAYYKFAQKYAAILKKEGFTLEVRATTGSIENIRLLLDPQSGVGAALVQSGLADAEAIKSLAALGSLYREPLWIFHRGTEKITNLRQLAGKRIAIGPPGDGTRAIAIKLLAANDITAKDATLTEESGAAAAHALANGTVDAGFFVAAMDSPYIRALLIDDQIRLVNFAQQAAYLRRFRYLAKVDLPAGVVDLGKNLPAQEVALVAPTAMLVVRNDLHPALKSLLLAAVAEVHTQGDLVSKPGEFPSPDFTDLPLSAEAKLYYKDGPPLLQRFLPFWLASPADRLKVMIIPILVVLMPLLRLAPVLVKRLVRRKVYLWYSVLRAIDKKLASGMQPQEAKESLAKLREIERQVLSTVDVPLSFMEEFYNLQAHILMLEQKLEKLLQKPNQ